MKVKKILKKKPVAIFIIAVFLLKIIDIREVRSTASMIMKGKS